MTNAYGDDLPVNEILLGDAITQMNSFPDRTVDFVFVDPPYFLQLENDLYRPNGTKVDGVDDQWDQFANYKEYDDFTRNWLIAAKRVMKDNAIIVVIGSYHNIYRLGYIMQNLGFWILNDILWVKSNPTPHMSGKRLCNAHETMICAVKDKNVKKYTFNYKQMKSGHDDKQLRSDWYFNVCSGAERIKRVDGTKAHSTQKPEALLKRLILAYTNEGDLVLDPMTGSGTTCAVAKKMNRNYIGIDASEDCVDVAKTRVESVESSPYLNDQTFKKKTKVSMLSLVESEILLKAGDTLRLYPKPHQASDIVATVLEDGNIKAGDKIGSVHQLGRDFLNLPTCNGWMVWHYYDKDDNKEKPIDELRTMSRLTASSIL